MKVPCIESLPSEIIKIMMLIVTGYDSDWVEGRSYGKEERKGAKEIRERRRERKINDDGYEKVGG